MKRYLPYYSDEERKRHLVRPGLTGYAQVHGRNAMNWEQRFQMDGYYVAHVSFVMDVKIIFQTIKTVLSHDGIEMNDLEPLDVYKKKQAEMQMIER